MSTKLNELMLKYAQTNQIENVAGCLMRGADIDYKNGALLLTAVWLDYKNLTKFILSAGPKNGLFQAINVAEKAENDKLLQMLNEYVAKNGITE